MEKVRRSAEYTCPMCGFDDSEYVSLDFDYEMLFASFKCPKCGIEYSVYYNCKYAGFGVGDAEWDENGEMVDDEE